MMPNVTRIESLTDEQKATFPAWVEQWVARGLSTTPLTEDEWATVESGARRSYRLSNLDEPQFILRMSSPFGAALAPILLAGLMKDDQVWAQVWDQVRAQVGAQVRAQVWDQVRAQVGAQVGDQVGDQVWAQVGAQVRAQVGDQVWAQVGAQVRAQVRDQVGNQVGAQVRNQVRDQVGDQVWAQVRDQVRAQVGAQVGAQVRNQVGAQVRDQVGDQVGAQVRNQVRAQVRAQVGNQVGNQVGAQVRNQVRAQVRAQVRNQVRDAYDYGNFEAGFMSWMQWFRQVGGLQLEGDKGERADAYCDARIAGPASWCRGVFAASDHPTFIHLDQNGALHGDNGPAIGWADGWALNVWHGTSVPDDFYTWDVERALKESNSEIRRCAIERIGWDALVDRLTLVDEADDPGNAPHKIRLYDLPDDLDLYDEDARILVVSNASLDKGGHRRVFGLPVPASHSDAISAAADLFDITPTQYRQLARAT